MKTIAFLLSLCLLATLDSHAQFGNILDRVNNAATNRANQKIDQGINKGLDKVEEGVKNGTKKPATQTAPTGNPDDQSTRASGTVRADTTASDKPVSLRSYANYDFVPGDKIIFADDFHTDQDGEFAEHWDLLNGQAILNN